MRGYFRLSKNLIETIDLTKLKNVSEAKARKFITGLVNRYLVLIDSYLTLKDKEKNREKKGFILNSADAIDLRYFPLVSPDNKKPYDNILQYFIETFG